MEKVTIFSSKCICTVFTTGAFCKTLLESKCGKIGQYTYRLDGAHSKVGLPHIHVLLKGKELFALNVDGSAHDGSHGVRIPNVIKDVIPRIFPSCKIPENGIIECMTDFSGFEGLKDAIALCESASDQNDGYCEYNPESGFSEEEWEVIKKAARILDNLDS